MIFRQMTSHAAMQQQQLVERDARIVELESQICELQVAARETALLDELRMQVIERERTIEQLKLDCETALATAEESERELVLLRGKLIALLD